MSTAEDELLDEYDDDDADDEGIYEDEEDIFDSEGKVDHKNPVITREQEQAHVYDIKGGREKPGGNVVKGGGKRQLVARADARGKWYVATFVDGKAVTKWKAPTVEQAKKLDSKGRVVKGGVVDDDQEEDETDDNDDAGDDVDLGEDTAKGMPTWGKVLIGVGVLSALGAGAYFIHKKVKSDDDAEVDEVDD